MATRSPLTIRYNLFKCFSIFMIVFLVMSFQPVQPVRATSIAVTITVDTLVDENDHSCSDGDCSLRDAIETSTSGAVIDFSVSGTITLGGTDIDIPRSLTIKGLGADNLTIDGAGLSRVFHVLGGTVVTISGLTVANGDSGSSDGGGIGNEGILYIDNCTVTNNYAQWAGGGVGSSMSGSLSISNSTISGNSTSIEGIAGGIYVVGSLTITNSTISGNSSGWGGGIFIQNSTATIIHSTISGNTADEMGGGLYNQASPGPSTISFENTLIAGNFQTSLTGNEDCFNAGGSLISQDYNLTGSGTGCSLGGAHDLTTADPMLGPLADNGGFSETHALLEGSPALDHIPDRVNGCGTTYVQDQRGEPRPQGFYCDIGAYESTASSYDNPGFNVPSKYRWYLKTDRTDGWGGVTSFGWGGVPELQPVVGDWNGDGMDTAAFYKPSQWRWFLKNDHTDGWAGVTSFQWGGDAEMIPIAGDWDGDGDDTVGFYKPSASEWYLKDDNTPGWTGFTVVVWGGASENIPLAGDWDGDGYDTIGFFVPSANRWWLKNDLADGWTGVAGFTFGTADPMDPVVGDWDGDGTDTVGGYVAAKWRWFLKDDQVTGWSNVSNFKFGVTAGYEMIAGDWE